MSSGTQLAARFESVIVERVDELVAEGRFTSRADALRHALSTYLAGERRQRMGEAVADGYRRVPQSDDELAGAEASARAMIAEEPW